MDNASFEADSDKQFEPAQDRQLNKYYSELSPSFECNVDANKSLALVYPAIFPLL